MDKPSNTSAVPLIPCDVCHKEVPLSAAVIPEATDYVAHFCGLECYSQWQKQSKHAGPQGEKAKK